MKDIYIASVFVVLAMMITHISQEGYSDDQLPELLGKSGPKPTPTPTPPPPKSPE